MCFTNGIYLSSLNPKSNVETSTGQAENVRASEQLEQVQEPVQQREPQPGGDPPRIHLPPHLGARYRLAQGPPLPLHQHGLGGAQHDGLLCVHQP